MEYKSIADALAAAEKKRSEKAAAASATRKSQAPRFGTARSPGSKPGGSMSPADGVDLRDDLDFPIESVDRARRSMAPDAAAGTMAVSPLIEKRQLSRAQAAHLVKQRSHYLAS